MPSLSIFKHPSPCFSLKQAEPTGNYNHPFSPGVTVPSALTNLCPWWEPSIVSGGDGQHEVRVSADPNCSRNRWLWVAPCRGHQKNSLVGRDGACACIQSQLPLIKELPLSFMAALLGISSVVAIPTWCVTVLRLVIRIVFMILPLFLLFQAFIFVSLSYG